ncbi:MAG: DUF6705 family protein, partial [Bacteroidota bacterium]
SFNCLAQSPILPLEEWDNEQSNAYYKDLNNELNPFEGIWLYTNGNNSWKIHLEKQIMVFNNNYYEDLIVGEYQYKINGLVVINTLSNIDVLSGYEHEITGNSIFDDCDYLPSSSCIDGEKRLTLTMSDPHTGHAATVILSLRTVNNQEALLAQVIFNQLSTYNGFSEPKPEPTMPWQQEYILIKQ